MQKLVRWVRSCREARAGNYRQIPEQVSHTQRKTSLLIRNLHLLGLQFIPQGSAAPTGNTGGSPGASQGHNYRWYSTFPEHLAKITELQWAGTPHKHLLPCHSWNSHCGTTVGMFHRDNGTGTRSGPTPWPFPPLFLAIPTLLHRSPKCHTHVSAHTQTHLRLWGEQ